MKVTVTVLTCRKAGCGGRGGAGVYGFGCWRFSGAGTCRGSQKRTSRGQGLTPLQQLLVLLLAEARGHLSGRVALLGLLGWLLLTSGGSALAIATARGYRWGGTGADGGRRRGWVELGRVWHCGVGRTAGYEGWQGGYKSVS